ncbi:DnaJ domain-containing protein [Natrinema thermotolerans]|uniref:DnaJ domain-containing protein n=1 Tax=Natrinema thermotolerans TaxID=121872 RepID=A0AAF0SYW3_9EURY|nr:DnaJ domain-containing protein [Natrinema thermotolerans]QCC60496.1 molecular chaperone DnaJ [Natrinema thermotolerans]QCC61396.1 molecular chaperone DnaJ [Natrinema thermotolerans]WMT07531.1 DnaJ domain-containing protein [Natrinema thermotolerans]WMT08163.1 DnaJ domain-containing protein [Natrinema thermotolerans]
MTEDFYDLLEISPDADQDEIKDAYREQVRVYHPDVNDDDRAQAQFTAVKTAYDILGDPVERQAYDRLGHEDYVAKRTSGLPSPDVWQSDDGDDEGTEVSYSESETASASASAAGASAAGSASSSAGTSSHGSTSTSSAGTSATSSAAGTGGAASSTDTSAAGATADASSATATGTATGTGGGTGSGTSSRTGGSGNTAGGTDRSQTTDSDDGSTANPIARWWRRRNVSLPLLWLSVIVYAAGLVQFALANEGALRSLRAELAGIGADPQGLWTALSADRGGVETTVAFMRGLEVVTPPLERPLWYGALVGVVALAALGLLVSRVVRREETWGPVTIDETIVVALSVAVPTTLIGGPLLAGAVLMPLLFGVVVRHTRRGPGWTPSYLYVLPVLAPLAAVGAAAAGVASLPLDIAAVVVLPLLGGLGLPLRATIRKRFGR